MADFISRLYSNPNETVEFKLTDHIRVRELNKDARSKLPAYTTNELFGGDLQIKNSSGRFQHPDNS